MATLCVCRASAWQRCSRPSRRTHAHTHACMHAHAHPPTRLPTQHARIHAHTYTHTHTALPPTHPARTHALTVLPDSHTPAHDYVDPPPIPATTTSWTSCHS
eukprot:105540-Chlamydomonas_euryale.AAC.1